MAFLENLCVCDIVEWKDAFKLSFFQSRRNFIQKFHHVVAGSQQEDSFVKSELFQWKLDMLQLLLGIGIDHKWAVTAIVLNPWIAGEEFE